MFHAQDDYVTEQAEPFRYRHGVAGLQALATTPKSRERMFLQLFIRPLAKGYDIRERRAPQELEIQIAFRMAQHTYWLVCWSLTR